MGDQCIDETEDYAECCGRQNEIGCNSSTGKTDPEYEDTRSRTAGFWCCSRRIEQGELSLKKAFVLQLNLTNVGVMSGPEPRSEGRNEPICNRARCSYKSSVQP